MPGGVCAVLDYDVELMAEYVAEMATRLALGNAMVSVSFRKFVSQILSSTRLPSTTILLGMNYLAKRINMMNMNSSVQRVKITEGQVWRMLTTAFLLGSKFLDDNTFQNRSWSEVSGIGVQELNTLEREWLMDVNWNLYVNLDRSKDYNAWLKSWQEWRETKKRQQAQATRERLMPVVPPIDTDVHRSIWHQRQVAEYERLQRLNRPRVTDLSPQSAVSGQDGWYSSRMGSWAAPNPAPISMPLTPPDSGYGTPEYLNSATINSAASHNSGYQEWFSRSVSNGVYSRLNQHHQPQPQATVPVHNPYHSRQVPAAHAGYYGYAHSHNIWDPNVADCSCGCAPSMHAKPTQYGFGMTPHGFGQTVMG